MFALLAKTMLAPLDVFGLNAKNGDKWGEQVFDKQ